MQSLKKAVKYHLIDKDLINEDITLLFDLYIPSEGGKRVERIFEKGVTICGDDKVRIRSIDALYVHGSDFEIYEEFTLDHVVSLATDENMDFSLRATAMYKKATKIVERLFENPDTMAVVDESKAVVSELVSEIMNDDFTLTSMMKLIAHDYYTHTHSLNVSIYAISLGKQYNLDKELLTKLGNSALLHDLGKSRVDKAIINKNGKLTDAEFKQMMDHPTYGEEIARSLGIEDKDVISGIRSHHEKMDGTGYPDRLKADKIPLFARIIAVCDVFDALTTKRSYKDAMTSFNAFKLMKEQMSDHLDSKLLIALVMMLRKEVA